MANETSSPEQAPSAAAAPEQGRVYLVVIDDTPEMRVALHYAALRACRTGGRVALLHVIEPPPAQTSIALEELMRAEERQEAEALLERLAGETQALTGQATMVYLREGHKRDQVQAQIDEDKAISILILASGTSDLGPGPLVQSLIARTGARLRIPVTIVPGGLTMAEIEAIA